MSFFSLKTELNHVTDLVSNPCSASWWAYIKTAVPAAASSLWMLVIPQPDEILEEYLDPKSTRAGPRRGPIDWEERERNRNKNKFRRRFGQVLNLNALIGDNLPGVEWFNTRRISKLEHIAWTGYNMAERGLFYWLLIDAADNFVYRWHSGIFEERFCSLDATSECTAHLGPVGLFDGHGQPPCGANWEIESDFGFQYDCDEGHMFPAGISLVKGRFSMKFSTQGVTLPKVVWISIGFRRTGKPNRRIVRSMEVTEEGEFWLTITFVMDRVNRLDPDNFIFGGGWAAEGWFSCYALEGKELPYEPM